MGNFAVCLSTTYYMEHFFDINELNLINKITAYLLSGDRRAAAKEYAYIVRKYSKVIIDFVSRMVQNRDDAQDIAQNVFVKAFNNLTKFEGRSNFSTWLTRIAYNEIINHLKLNKIHYVNIDDTPTSCCDISDDELSTNNEERIQRLEKAIDLLPPDDQMLLHLFYYENKPMKEIGFIMNAEPRTLTVRLHRIRKRLLEMII